jgi:glycosyltransferase involved in cell wall biosynthesis
MKIGIDARFLTHPQKGGFKTYTENLISALAEVDQDNSYVLYLDRSPDQETRLPKQLNFIFRVIPGQHPLFGMPWREQFGLPRWAAKDRLDLLHSPCLTAPLRLNCASVVTIHDMIWHSSANNSVKAPVSIKRKLMNWYYSFVPQLAARNAALILTVSQASKDRITQILGIPAQKIFVTYEAADPIFRKILDSEQICAVRKKYDLTTKYIMAIGSADPRKNIATLVRAYAQLPASLKADYQLVIVWTHSLMAEKLMELVNDLELKERVRFVNRVSNEDLVLLYNAASLFVFPSLDEGFGLPPLEAMACGTPVVAANNSSIPEICGDSALLFDTNNANDLADKIVLVLSDFKFKSSLVQKGFEQRAKYSWEKCARETGNVYCKTSSSEFSGNSED